MNGSDLFIVYTFENLGCGNFVLPYTNPPKSYDEIKLLENEIEKVVKSKVVIVNWKVIQK